ncbi:STY4534 family ICE replication protein [Pseudomonas moraviensis]
MSNASSNETYFDLHTCGLGYLNRIREVKPKKGDPFLACEIFALNGPTDNPEYRRFDVKVTGEQAQVLIRRCTKAVNMDLKVLVGFRLGDLWVDTFTYTKGDKAGQQGISLKARLLLLYWIKIEGVCVHKRDTLIKDVEMPATAQGFEPVSEPSGESQVMH